MKKFKYGDRVVWVSQASGSAKEKEGVVIGVVPPNKRPNCKNPEYESLCRMGIGGPRDHESYVVKAKGKCYWPRVRHLREVGDE